MSNKISAALLIAFSAQFLGLIFSAIVNIFAPLIYDIKSFNYIQLFILYIGFSSFFGLGISEGLYLKYTGNKSYFEKTAIPSFLILLLSQTSVLLSIFLIFKYDNNDRFIIKSFAIVYFFIVNIYMFFSYVLQIYDKVVIYSISIIIDKISNIIGIVILYFINCRNIYLFFSIFILSKIIALCYVISPALKNIKICKFSLKEAFNPILSNTISGFLLIIINLTTFLNISSIKIIIDMFFGISEFGKASFSFSISNIVISFISQASIVLFPSLRNINPDKLIVKFNIFNKYINTYIIIPVAFIFPLYKVASCIFPELVTSPLYFSCLIPFCILESKNQLQYYTYMKVIRKEKFLFLINMISLLLLIILSNISALIIHNIFIILFILFFVTFAKSMFLTIYIGKKYFCEKFKGSLNLYFYILLFFLSSISINNGVILSILSILLLIIYYVQIFLKTKISNRR